jgi:hypothetical protein
VQAFSAGAVAGRPRPRSLLSIAVIADSEIVTVLAIWCFRQILVVSEIHISTVSDRTSPLFER